MKKPSRFRFLTNLFSPAPQLREEGMFALRRSVLPNGLRVWVKPRPGTGTVFLALQVPVGSRHETETNNGISHFLEHMLFTGTAKWTEQEVIESVRRREGEVNARTTAEDTVFWLHLRADDLDFGIDRESSSAPVGPLPEVPQPKTAPSKVVGQALGLRRPAFGLPHERLSSPMVGPQGDAHSLTVAAAQKT